MTQPNDTTIGPNPSGICFCGCGGNTPLASQTKPASQLVKGLPIRYIHGHFSRMPRKQAADPNPSGLCGCGCGEKTPIAQRTVLRENKVRGFHRTHVPGHGRRMNPPIYVINEVTGCWDWQGTLSAGGYGIATKCNGTRLAHRIEYEKRYGPIAKGLEAHHKCGNRACVNPDHIEPLPPLDHVRADRLSIPDSEIANIRKLAESKSHREIARMYGVTHTTIGDILKR